VTGNGKKGIQGKTFTGFEEMRRATGYEENSLLVDGDSVLVDAPSDLRPREGTLIVDAGARLPGINDDFSGKGPDIGAFEAGQPLPICGPRSGSYLERLEKMRKGEYVPKYESAASQEE
jgi:hypothetical protein